VPAALAAVGDVAATVVAAEAVGAAERALERTVEYVRQREQFGRAIGSFQAVKHRLADVYVQVQAARSAAYYAAWAAGAEAAGFGGQGAER
ncbi:acyl-CoA dehydrogenase, partial [Streptomyces sp. SID10115]|uniref:acyl-CoA dehydrogenase family protein n=2 Tax=Streptomyces TaxID=1883 RepID=UPI0013C686AB